MAASIDTPLHGFLPFPHVDHLHPDWGIALAASANGKAKMDEFNREFGHKLVWIPWQRPGFELAMMMKRAVEENPGCDGIVLGGHGLFTWGETQRECYVNTLTVIDQLGQFIESMDGARAAVRFGGAAVNCARGPARNCHRDPALPARPRQQPAALDCQLQRCRRCAAVRQFEGRAGSWPFLAPVAPITSSAPRFGRCLFRGTRAKTLRALKQAIDSSLDGISRAVSRLLQGACHADSPAMRDANPAVVLIPGLGMFSFGKNKTEARITGEFYTNAIHVMEGASLLAEGDADRHVCRNARRRWTRRAFAVFTQLRCAAALEAFRIEYWALEEAKIRRQPAEKELSRRIALVVGGGSGIGREVALLAAERGAHVVVADRDAAAAAQRGGRAWPRSRRRNSCARSRSTFATALRFAQALEATIAAFGGVDILINTAAHLSLLAGWRGQRRACGPRRSRSM